VRAQPLLRSKLPLVSLCVLTSVAEASILAGIGASWAAGLAPQVSAVAPFGVFHDLRWLVVYHRSWFSFGWEMALLLGFRSVLDAGIIRLAWPEDAVAPSFLAALRRTLIFTGLAVVVIAPWVLLLFGLSVVSLSWLFFAAVPPVVWVAMLIHPGAVSPGWWRRTVPLRAVGWVALTFGVMTLAAGVVSYDRRVLGLPVAALCGLFNAWAWRGMVSAVASPFRSNRFRPVAPAGLAAIVGVVVGGTALGFGITTARVHAAGEKAAAAPVAPPSHGPPLMVASGFGTKWDGRSGPWLAGPFDETRFSYRGLDPAGQPLPYGPQDTDASLEQSAAAMAAQVDALANRTHRRVDIVAASEASLVTEVYLAGWTDAPVDHVVLLSPIVRPGRVYYPPPGTAGWGMVSGLGLRAITNALGSLGPFQVSPGTPLFASIERDAPMLQTALSCPPPTVRLVAILPLADAVASPIVGSLGPPTVVVPAFHSGTLGDPSVDQVVISLLEGNPVPHPGGWSRFDRALRGAATAWQVPELALSVNPAWALPPGSCGTRPAAPPSGRR